MMSKGFSVSLAAAFLAAVPFASLPAAQNWRGELPRPVFDEKPELVDFYYKAWELAHSRIDEVPGLPAPRYMDEAHRSDRIWIWDTCFMVHFCKYCPKEFPGIQSLENFYGVMLADKAMELPKVKGNRWCGADEGKMLDFKIHHPDNPPLFAWTEYVYALLYERNEDKANRTLERFVKVGEKYPYKSDLDSERELMDIALKKYKETLTI